MSKRVHITFTIGEIVVIVAEVTKKAVVYASIKKLVNTDADEVHHGS